MGRKRTLSLQAFNPAHDVGTRQGTPVEGLDPKRKWTLSVAAH